MYLNSVQQMVSGELAGEGLQRGFSRHGLPSQRAPLDTVYPLREHLNSVQGMVSGGYCEGFVARHGLLDTVKKHMGISSEIAKFSREIENSKRDCLFSRFGPLGLPSDTKLLRK